VSVQVALVPRETRRSALEKPNKHDAEEPRILSPPAIKRAQSASANEKKKNMERGFLSRTSVADAFEIGA
jgi:hypothetical protein